MLQATMEKEKQNSDICRLLCPFLVKVASDLGRERRGKKRENEEMEEGKFNQTTSLHVDVGTQKKTENYMPSIVIDIACQIAMLPAVLKREGDGSHTSL